MADPQKTVSQVAIVNTTADISYHIAKAIEQIEKAKQYKLPKTAQSWLENAHTHLLYSKDRNDGMNQQAAAAVLHALETSNTT